MLSSKQLTPPTAPAPAVGAKRLTAQQMYNGETLFHGPLLQGLREATSITSDALDARCVEVPLDAAQAGQFGDTRSVIDGFAADVMMQAALVWVRETHGFACLPSGFSAMEWHRSLPAGGEYFLSLRITSSTATTVIATCTMHDQAGTVYMVGRGLTLVINKTLKYGSGAAPQATTSAVATNGAPSFAAQPKGSKLTAEIDYQRSQAVKYAATGKPNPNPNPNPDPNPNPNPNPSPLTLAP